MRIIALLGLFGCSTTPGERWARQHLGSDGARVLENEARGWLEQHPNPPIVESAHCPPPRVLMRVSDSSPYHLEYSPLNSDPIHGVEDVRCLVLYTHHGQEMAHHPETRLSVRLVDRKSGSGQLINVRDHEGALEEILRQLQ